MAWRSGFRRMLLEPRPKTQEEDFNRKVPCVEFHPPFLYFDPTLAKHTLTVGDYTMRLAPLSAFSFILLFLVVSLLPAQQRGAPSNPTRGWLTVETIMRDPKWMGTSPSRPFWSEDGENIYFNWRQKGDEGDSLYVVSAKGGTPRHVTIEEQRRLPGRSGSYNKDKTKRLYAKGSDVFLLDIRAKKEIQLTSTTTPESNPRFTFDEQKIVFERQGNLFLRDLRTSAETQLTNLQGAGGFSQ